MNKKLIGLIFTLLSLAPITLAQPIYWHNCDWQPVTQFPKDFVFGAGHSHYQYEGKRQDHLDTDYNNFDLLADTYTNGKRHTSIEHLCGDACKGWDKALQDVDLVYDIGLDVYRMSVSWEKINPAPGVFDSFALEHYVAVLDKCNQLGIKVLMGLHHYTDPVWFSELGGWTKRKNIQYFTEFAREVYKALGDRVWLWATFNSPSGYAAKCFLTGEMIAAVDSKNHPVSNKKDFSGHANMLCNLCLAHVEVYNALKEEYIKQHKAQKYSKEPQVGILKNILQIDGNYWWDTIPCKLTDNLLDQPMFTFFTTGNYPNYIGNKILAQDARAPFSLDFVGLNYYSHKQINNFKPGPFENEITTQNHNYTIYPEGLYYALETIDEKLVHPVSMIRGKQIPLYVTENGIAAIESEHRELFFKRYLYALNKAIDNGINVKGYITWSLMDNYEWGSYNKKYGLYSVDFNDPDRTRTLKTDAGTQYFVDLIRNTKTA